jgi:hypothetical protein
MSFSCFTCGELHDGLPDMSLDKPDYYWGVPEEERSERIKLTSDTCVIDDEDFFIRGVIEIPIHDYPENFGFGVWVSQKRENFEHYLENFDSDNIGPFFGWLSTSISYYSDDTLSLQTMAHFRGQGERPRIELEPTDHPMFIDQQEGITLEKAWEIVHFFNEAEKAGDPPPQAS